MSRSASFDARPGKSLSQMYDDLEDNFDDEEFLHRIEQDFGAYDKSDIFIQTDGFNVFLYLDGGTFHGLTDEMLEEENEVLKYIEEEYDIDLKDLEI